MEQKSAVVRKFAFISGSGSHANRATDFFLFSFRRIGIQLITIVKPHYTSY